MAIILFTIHHSLFSIAQPNISRVEYYVDTDPGYGNGINVPFSGTNNITTSFTVNMAPLNQGVHVVGVRSRDVNGAWSLDNKWIFLKPYAGGGSVLVPNINRVEYFIDADPGYGKGTALSIVPGTNLAGLSFNINTTPLNEGVHIIGIRSLDANGAWSLDNRWLFLKPYNNGGGIPVPNITRAEWFLDQDPGYGNGNSIPLVAGKNLSGLSFSIDMTPLNEGVHIIGVRSKDANGVWSLDNRWLFLKPYNNGQPIPHRIITNVEYYLDTDPGYGKGTPVAISPKVNLADQVIESNISALSAGKHKLYFRSKDAFGTWSLDNVDSFTIATPVAAPKIVVNSVAKTSMCVKDSFNVGYDITGSYNAGNTFKAYLSNSAGSFAAETEIGTITATTDGLIKCKLPASMPPDGSGYKIRVKSSNPVLISDTSYALNFYDKPHFANDTTITIICDPINLNEVYNTAGYSVTWSTGNPGAAGSGTYQAKAINDNGCSDTVSVLVKQDIATWTGATNTSWHTATNWSGGHVPTIITHVIVPDGLPNCVVSTADAVAASVQVRPGAVLNVINSRNVDISGKCSILPTGP